MKQLWYKQYKNFPYLIREDGKILSLPRHTAQLKTVQPKMTSDGYEIMGLHYNGKRYWKSVHRMVAESFICDQPEGKQIDHIDNERSNNHYSNLRWVTAQENTDHKCKQKRHSFGTNHYASKLTESDVKEIKELKGTKTLKEVGEIYGVGFTAIHKIWNGERWKHLN